MKTKSFRIGTALVLAMLVLAVAGAVVPAQAQTYTVIHDFTGFAPDAATMNAQAIAQGRDGNLYSTTEFGGNGPGGGTVFSVTPSGTLTVVNNVGFVPRSGVTLGTDGNFYGTDYDGPISYGQVYKVTPAGVETVLYNFTGTGDGAFPSSAPIEGTDGKFYGTATGVSGLSTAYSVTSGGVFTTLHNFTAAEGQYVYAGLVQGTDGNFYGVAWAGGPSPGWGTIFKMTKAGAVTVLHNFTNTDGYQPATPLIQASDGNFYGVASQGGFYGCIFKITSNGTYTVLHSFATTTLEGENPSSSLVQATDGKLYGVTQNGGTLGGGTIYSITTTGTFSVLYNFDGTNTTNGYNPMAPLRQNTNGTLYGGTDNGGTSTNCTLGCGVVYSLDMGLGPFVNLVSTSGKEGVKIGILGQGFTSASVVKFGGVQATTIMRTGTTFINATVPAGALTAAVTVTTGATTLTSPQTFKVTPTFPSFSPTSGSVGTPVVLTGTGLIQTTKVTFGGVRATTFTVNSDTQVTANVPTGAVTGRIGITTKGGSATSTTNFTVL
jgi:uncharacterized repeat protein (TIGR03803 family)